MTDQIVSQEEHLAALGKYEYGWADADVAGAAAQRGLSEAVVRDISAKKNEPEWMLNLRLKGLRLFDRKPMPSWGADLTGIDFQNIKYFVRSTEKQAASWDDLPDDIKATYDKLGIPEAEKQRLVAGVAAQYESEVVYHKIREDLEEQGVVFLDTDTALKQHEDIFKEYFGTVIPVGDNKFAALNTSVWSGGSFIYVPKGVHVEIPLQAYFRINTENMGQFERTLIIADEGSYVHYVEGCTAPIYSSDSLHSAVVEIIVKKNARVRYTTIQNWSNNVYNLVTKRATCEEGATMEWIDGNIGSKVTMKYPAVYMTGPHAKGEVLSVAMAGEGQHQDAGAKMVHAAPYTSSTIVHGARGDGLQGQRGPALLPDEPGPHRGRGDGDDRAWLHRADRQGAADGVRPRTQPSYRAPDGRRCRLSHDDRNFCPAQHQVAGAALLRRRRLPGPQRAGGGVALHPAQAARRAGHRVEADRCRAGRRAR
jgi:Fe-S cluster assembly protein SufB